MRMLFLINLFFLLSFSAEGSQIGGGVDGGGGGDTLPEDRISVENVYLILNSSKSILRQYFRGLERNGYDKPQPYDDLLFRGASTIFDVLENTELEIRTLIP